MVLLVMEKPAFAAMEGAQGGATRQATRGTKVGWAARYPIDPPGKRRFVAFLTEFWIDFEQCDKFDCCEHCIYFDEILRLFGAF
jgi:hypothetical protein